MSVGRNEEVLLRDGDGCVVGAALVGVRKVPRSSMEVEYLGESCTML